MIERPPKTLAVATSPAERSGDHGVEALIDDRPPEPIDSAYHDIVQRGLAAARTGDIATDDEVRTTLDRYRL